MSALGEDPHVGGSHLAVEKSVAAAHRRELESWWALTRLPLLIADLWSVVIQFLVPNKAWGFISACDLESESVALALNEPGGKESVLIALRSPGFVQGHLNECRLDTIMVHLSALRPME